MSQPTMAQMWSEFDAKVKGALMTEAEQVEEPDDCPYCNATGEGHYDGTICQPCRGTGKQVGGGWDEDGHEEPGL